MWWLNSGVVFIVKYVWSFHLNSNFVRKIDSIYKVPENSVGMYMKNNFLVSSIGHFPEETLSLKT